jgi:hypothetical protein
MEKQKEISPKLLDAVARAKEAVDNCKTVRFEVGNGSVYSLPVAVVDTDTMNVLISAIEENWKLKN